MLLVGRRDEGSLFRSRDTRIGREGISSKSVCIITTSRHKDDVCPNHE